VATRVRARAYGFHRGAGASSKASLKLLYDGSPAGEATDQTFNLANLQVVNNIILDPGQSAAFALQSTNGSGVTERYVGLEFWLSAA
jgi:hypothetical protein